MTEQELRNKLLDIMRAEPDSIINYARKIEITGKDMSTFF